MAVFAFQADNYFSQVKDVQDGAEFVQPFFWTVPASGIAASGDTGTVQLCRIPVASGVILTDWFIDTEALAGTFTATLQDDQASPIVYLASSAFGSAGEFSMAANGARKVVPQVYAIPTDGTVIRNFLLNATVVTTPTAAKTVRGWVRFTKRGIIAPGQ